jgi:hypothetical protein
MGHYTSVRGWLELNEEMVSQVQKIIKESFNNKTASNTPCELAELYNRGWVFPIDHINWTYYVFYGADIRTRHISYIKEQLMAIAANIKSYTEELRDVLPANYINYPSGIFYIDDEDNEFSLYWELKNGQFTETSRK